jgi:glucose/arabinose dehydrogenase
MKQDRAYGVISCGLLLAIGLSVHGAALPANFSEAVVATGISNPTAMAFAPGGRIFVSEQTGNLRVIKNGSLLATPFVTLTVDSSGERGLLGIAFDPNFASNRFIYLYYTVTSTPRHNRVSRFTANGDVAVPGSEAIIMDLDPLSSATNHNGGAIHFGPDGKLYAAVGENANGANAQSLDNRLGKVLRINADGSIPTDNPFYNTAVGDNRSIWVLGLRNPFTFDFQPGSGRMFINDVGQNTWEEIDDGIAGSNYGWPTTEGPTTDPRYRAPIYAYDHSSGACAITGGTFYNPSSAQFPSSYVGKYFFADLCGGWIHVFDPGSGTAGDFATGISQPVDLHAGPDGKLYYLARGSGQVVAIESNLPPPSPTPTPSATPSATATPSQPLQISTRLRVETGDNVLIGGFIITGSGNKQVLVRGIGPSLAAKGVTGPLNDPVLALHASDRSVIASNDNWQDSQRDQILQTGAAPGDDREAALVATLQTGAYTAIVSGKDNTSGVGLAEVYDLQPGGGSRIANLSTRGFVRNDPDVMIGGVILGGNSGSASVVFRALGPSLANSQLTTVLNDPVLDLRDQNGVRVAINDNWQDDPAQAAQLSAAGLAPGDSRESAMAVTLTPAAYTAIVTGKNGGTGLSLVELYDLSH